MVPVGVASQGVLLGSSLVVVGSFVAAVIRVVVNVYTMCKTQTLPLSLRLSGEVWGVPLWA